MGYRSKLNRIALPEIAGGIVCIAAAVFILFNFYKLNTFFLQGAGVVSILLLLALPAISLQSTWQLSKMVNVQKAYAATLQQFAIEKIKFVRLQKLNVTLSYLLLVTIIVLLSKLFGDKDISNNKYYWIFSFSFGYIFLQFYAKWVMKHYGKTLQQSEELLTELAA